VTLSDFSDFVFSLKYKILSLFCHSVTRIEHSFTQQTNRTGLLTSECGLMMEAEPNSEMLRFFTKIEDGGSIQVYFSSKIKM